MTTTLSLSSMIVATTEHVCSDLGGEAIILSLTNGVYYGLNAVAVAIWEMLKRPCTVAEILEALVHKYDVDRSQCESDLLSLLEELEKHTLVRAVRVAAA